MNLYPQLLESFTTAATLVGRIRPDQLAAPTPCPEYDLRTLLNHYVLWTGYSAERRALKQEVGADLTDRDFLAEPDWAAAYAAQADRAAAAWSRPEAWEGESSPGSAAAMTGSLILLELVLHGWDVARAAGLEFACSEEVAEAALTIVGEYAEMYRQYEGFDAEVAVDGTASALERALALSGRDPHWT